jgi:EAL domain-containing protein (putative c-di-GMP-specific phosphodiesterase class I)
MHAHEKLKMGNQLYEAIEKQELHLYYQIQVDHLNQPLGAEALIRWLHSERGMVPPMHFIPLAEESGLILSIGYWVLDTACAQLKKCQQFTATCDLILAVNVSSKQFRHDDFIVQVREIVQCHEINPALLKLEITEGLLLKNIEDVIVTMNVLKALGVQFSLDDFGTGYSCLQYLKRLPFNQLKIDQSSVRHIDTDSSDKAIVRIIIAMAQNLDLDVIAEGVET